MLSWISIPIGLGKECRYCRNFLTGKETGICNTCREDLQCSITKTSYSKKVCKVTGTSRRKVAEEPWLQELRTPNVEEIVEVSELKAFLKKYFLKNGVDMKDIDKYCRLKKITVESFISNLKSKLKKLDDSESNYIDNLIKLFYFRNENVSPLERIELFQKCLNDQEFLSDLEFLHNYFFQYKIKMEDIVQYCKYEKQINLESFISDMRSKIKKLYETEYNYSGRKKVKIGVKKLIQLFYLRNEGEPRLKCIGLFQNCLDDYFENFKKCKQECMVNITRLRDEDIKQHVGAKKPRPAKEEIQKSDSLNLSAREKYEGNEANRQIADINEPNLVVADRNEINIKVPDRNEANLEAANRKKANLEATDINEPNFVVANRNEINLKVVDRNKAKLEAADRKKANLEATDINEPNFEATDINETNLVVAHRNEINLRVADRNEANLEAADRKKANLKAADRKKANLEDAVRNETNFEITERNESSNSSNLIPFVYEGNISTTNSDDENALNKKREKHLRPHIVSKNNKLQDGCNEVLNEVYSDFLNMVFPKRKSEDIVSKKLADIDNNTCESNNNNDKNLITRKSVEVSVKITSDVITPKTSSAVCTNDIKAHVPSSVISVEQIDGNLQKEKKSGHFSAENDIGKKNSEYDINEITDKMSSRVCKKDIKDMTSRVISIEQTGDNLQKERKSEYFSAENDVGKKGSKHDIEEISDSKLQKSSSVVCKNDIKDKSSRIISVGQTESNGQKERKPGLFSTENDIGKESSNQDIHEISNSISQKESSVVCKKDIKNMPSRVISIEQTGDNLQKERKSEYFSAEKDVGKKGSKHDIQEISDSTLQKSSSVVCKNDIKNKSSKIISVGQTEKNLEKERKSRHLSTENYIEKECSKQDIDEISDSTLQKTSVVCKNDISMSTKVSVEQTDDSMQKERKSGDISTENDIGKEGIKHDIDEISDSTSQKSSSVVCKNDIKEKSSRIISVEPTENNLEKERKSGHLRTENDIGKEGIKQDIGEISDSTSQKTLSEVCQNDIINMSTKVSGEQTDDNMQKERKSGHISTENDIGKEGIKHDIDEISDSTSQKSSSVVCKNDIKDKSSRIISVEPTENNLQKERKSGHLRTENDIEKEDRKQDIDEISDSTLQKTSVVCKNDISMSTKVSVESTENNMEKERKSRHISTENDIGKEGSKHDIDEISGNTSQKSSSVVCKNDIKDKSSRIISVESTENNLQKERKSRHISTENDIGEEGSKQDIDEISVCTSQKTLSEVCQNDIIHMSSEVISVEQTGDNLQNEKKSGYLSTENDIGKEGSKQDIDEISFSTSQKMSVVCKNDVIDMSSKVSIEQTDDNMQKERKSGHFSSENDTGKEGIKHDIHEFSDSTSQKTCLIVCKEDIKDKSSKVISVEQTDSNLKKKRKLEDFNIKNAIRKKRSKNETFLQYDIDKQEIVKKTEISDIASEKTSSVLCENDIEEVVLPRVISVEQKDDNRQKKRKREDNRDNISQRLADSSKELRIATNKRPRLVTGNDTEHYAPSICYYQGNQNSQKERKFVKLNKDNFLSAKNVDMEFRYFLNAVVINNSITVNILCLGDQNEIVLTERNDSKFISDGDEKSVTKIYEFFFNFKKSTSPRRPCRSTSHSISSDVTSQSTDSPRIIYRSEISIFIPDGQMPSRKDCIDYLTKHWYEFVNKTSEKRLLKKCVLKTAAGASKDKDLSEELRTRKQEDGMSAILRPFGYERKSMESESSDKHEVLKREKQKVIHEKLRLSSKSIPAEDEIRVSVGRSQNSMPSIDLNENKSIFSKRSKHPDKPKEMSSVNLSSLGYDRFHYGSYISPDEEVTPEPVVQNKKQLFHVIEDLLKKFNIDDNEAQPFHPVPSRREFTIDEDQILDLNFTPVHNNLFGSFEKVLSANIDGPEGQNHAKSSHSSDPIWHNYAKSPYDSACHGYEETFDAASEDSYESEDSDAFSLCSDPYSVFDNGPFNLLKECGGSSSDDDVW